MSAPKHTHTPGPWLLGETSICDSVRHIYAERAGMLPVVADVYLENHGEPETGEANALLITAAPALLEALQSARGLIAAHRQNLHDCHAKPDGNVTDEFGLQGLAEYDAELQQIDAAISAATGGQQ